jgi:cardiolipin synthase A/B
MTGDSEIPFVSACSYPRRAGNAVRPLVDGIPAYRRIAEVVAAARRSIWLVVTFVSPDFHFPDGSGALFEVLNRATARGLDVRVIFWRPNPESAGYGSAFAGLPAEREMLAALGSRFRIRWDRSAGPYCQHQKAWLIDAGEPSEVAFVGGMNLTAKTLGLPGHSSGGQFHDLYVEISGPSATDVHHNFVQRWNEASERDLSDGTWGHDGKDELPFPVGVAAPRGDSIVQVQRMVPAGRYSDSHPSPDSVPFGIADGENSILSQYIAAIGAARRTIYIENQSIPIPQVASALEQALRRGVDIVMLVPGQPLDYVRTYRKDPARKPMFDGIAALGGYENFALAGIAAPTTTGGRSDIYVHAKIMLVDDAWATIGSCNLHGFSLGGHTEMNAAIWERGLARSLRCELLSEHLGCDTSALDDRAALKLYRAIARANRHKRDAEDFEWQGLAYDLDAASYGE